MALFGLLLFLSVYQPQKFKPVSGSFLDFVLVDQKTSSHTSNLILLGLFDFISIHLSEKQKIF